MATQFYGVAKGCIFTWKIQNVSHCWWLGGRDMLSPSFIVEELEGTKWSLQLCSLGCTDDPNIGFYLLRDTESNGPKTIDVNFQLAFIGKDGSILKEKSFLKNQFNKSTYFGGFLIFEERRKVFITDREAFMPEDTLTAQCTIWIENEKTLKLNNLFATTVIETKRRSFEWRIDRISTVKSEQKKKFIDSHFDFNVVLKLNFDELNIQLISFDECIKYISINSSLIDSEGKKTSCGIVKYFRYDLERMQSRKLSLPKLLKENKSRYLPNDNLSLDFEFVFSTVEHFDDRKNSSFLKNEEMNCTSILIDEFKRMYRDGLLSDMEIRTPTKTFRAHRSILSARSAVFSRMFSNDMKETNSGYVDIADFEEDTVHRMLLYIYTASLDDLQYESASKLYEIADKYEILSLKNKCSNFFIENLCSRNACGTLILADLHNDEDMKIAVLNYILGQRSQFFFSQEWKDFMNNHNKLAGDVMYKKITKR